MFKAILGASLTAAVLACPLSDVRQVRGGDADWAGFEQFVTDFGRLYETVAEVNIRFDNFKSVVARNVVLNKANPLATFGINKFADLSVEEFKYLYLSPFATAQTPASQELMTKYEPEPVQYEADGSITNVDWCSKGACSAIKNQGQCGSCWAFSATEVIESAIGLSGKGDDDEEASSGQAGSSKAGSSQHGSSQQSSKGSSQQSSQQSSQHSSQQPSGSGSASNSSDSKSGSGKPKPPTPTPTPGKVPVLAPQQIVDCSTANAGCGGGDPRTAIQYVVQAGGLEGESSYPYVSGNSGKATQCSFDASKVAGKATGYTAVSNGSEQSLQSFLQNSGPPSVAVDASSWQTYQKGVISQCGCQIDHAVQATGIDASQGTQAYQVRNSWGADWGVEGYIYLAIGHNTCCIANEVTFATV